MLPFSTRERCVLCASNQLQEIVKFRDTPIANRLPQKPLSDIEKKEERIPLSLICCMNCSHVQIRELVPPEILFSNYPYTSSTNEMMRKRLRVLASNLLKKVNHDSLSTLKVLEIGSNDGYLLQELMSQGCQVLGIDPAESVTQIALAKEVPTITDYFGGHSAQEILGRLGKPDLIIANNVLAHTDELQDIFATISTLMHDNSLLYVEFSYLLDVVKNLLIDTIYHEHTSYHSLCPLVKFLEKYDLRIINAERFDAHGGSMGVSIVKINSRKKADIKVEEILKLEEKEGLGSFNPALWKKFNESIETLSLEVRQFLSERKSDEKLIGYGISAKFATMYFGIGLDQMDFDILVDDNPLKIGRYAPGTSIQIQSAQSLVEIEGKKIIFVFSWNYKEEIFNMLRTRVKSSKILFPLPRIMVETIR